MTAVAQTQMLPPAISWWKSRWKAAIVVSAGAGLFTLFRPSTNHTRTRAFAAMDRPGVSLTMVGGDLDSARFQLKPGLEGPDGNLGWAFHQLIRFPEVRHVETHFFLTVNLPVLRRLKNLESFSINEWTELEDEGLEAFQGMMELQSLVLHGDKLTPRGLKHLEGLPKLKTLRLSGQKFVGAGFESIGRIPNLETLVIEGGRGKWEAPLDLGTASKLKILRLSSIIASASDLKPLVQLKSLEELNLWNVHTDEDFFRGLKELPRLRVLRIAGNDQPLDGAMTQIAAFPALEELSLLDYSGSIVAHILTAKGAAELSVSKTLREVAIFGAPIGDEGIKSLAKIAGLKTLILNQVRATEASFPSLLGMRGLEKLTLYEPKYEGYPGIAPEALARLRNQLLKQNKTEMDFSRGLRGYW